jgi:hypothetical protein
MSAKISSAVRQRAKRIKLFLCDVDGVLTCVEGLSSLDLHQPRS